MSWKAMDEFKEGSQSNGSDSSAPSNGGSIQDRLNKMRRNGNGSGETNPRPRRVVNESISSSEEEAFVNSFAQDLEKKISQEVENPADILQERMREVREGWGANRKKHHPRPMPKPALPAVQNSSEELPAEGTLLAISSNEIAVFHKDVPSKGYQLVYMINADGTVSPQGIYLNAYEYRAIGMLSPVAMADIRKNMTWDRDILVFHLNDVQFAHFIPRPSDRASLNGHSAETLKIDPPDNIQSAEIKNFVERRSAAQDRVIPERLPSEERRVNREPVPEQTNEPEPNDTGLRRGRRFRISMGKGRDWDAVFWGTDEQGTVVAHKTHGDWTLMHLDIDRFSNSLNLNGQLDDAELREVEKSLLEQHGD